MKTCDTSINIDIKTKLRKNEGNTSKNVIMIIAIILEILMAIGFIFCGIYALREKNTNDSNFAFVFFGISITNILAIIYGIYGLCTKNNNNLARVFQNIFSIIIIVIGVFIIVTLSSWKAINIAQELIYDHEFKCHWQNGSFWVLFLVILTFITITNGCISGIIGAIYGFKKGINLSMKAFSITTIGLILINIFIICIVPYLIYEESGENGKLNGFFALVLAAVILVIWLTFSVYHGLTFKKKVKYPLKIQISIINKLMISVLSVYIIYYTYNYCWNENWDIWQKSNVCLFIKICTICTLTFSIISFINGIIGLYVKNIMIKMIYIITSITTNIFFLILTVWFGYGWKYFVIKDQFNRDSYVMVMLFIPSIIIMIGLIIDNFITFRFINKINKNNGNKLSKKQKLSLIIFIGIITLTILVYIITAFIFVSKKDDHNHGMASIYNGSAW